MSEVTMLFIFSAAEGEVKFRSRDELNPTKYILWNSTNSGLKD